VENALELFAGFDKDGGPSCSLSIYSETADRSSINDVRRLRFVAST
jgi:hypothetical protein